MSQACLWPDTARIDPRADPVRSAIAVYLLELDIPVPVVLQPHYLSYLGVAEGKRWRAIRSAERQWQYLQSRVLRRVVLGAYTERAPAQLTFARNQSGHTRLADDESLSFSLTQCASHVALAVGSDPVLGIDVENVFPVRPSFMQIARDQFGATDLDQLLACPEPRRYSCFLELWTLKQAYLKALGLGKHKPMAQCNFSRTSAGLLVCQDREPPPDREAPTGFLSETINSCQLALAYRAGQPVSLRYLNASSVAHAGPRTQPDSGDLLQPGRDAIRRRRNPSIH